MFEKLKTKLYHSRLDTRTAKEQHNKEKSITDVLLWADFLSNEVYEQIVNGEEFHSLPEERQWKIKIILKMLNNHFKEHQIHTQVMLDEPDEKAELYQQLLFSMQATLFEIDKHVVVYEEAIKTEISRADIAFQQKKFTDAYMIANLARNLAKPFASTMSIMLENLKKPFINTGANMQNDPRFSAIYNQLHDKTELLESYEKRFSRLYKEAEKIVTIANKNVWKVDKHNHTFRKNITIDGSPELIGSRNTEDVSGEKIDWTGRRPIIGYGDAYIWFENAKHQRYTYVERWIGMQFGNDFKFTPMHIVKPDSTTTKYAIFSKEGEPLFDWLFLKYKYIYTNEGYIKGIKIKQTTDNSDFIELKWNEGKGKFNFPA